MPPTTPQSPPPHGLNIAAGVIAAILPGLGHIYRGDVRRGLLAAAGVLGLFFGGIFIGGIDVIDSREDRWWFIGQALTGPVAFITDAVHQRAFKAYGPVRRGYRPDAEVFRSGFPDETRAKDASGRPVWDRLTPDQIAAGKGPPSRKSIGRMNELGTLYALIAGMLNLIVILDALFPTLRPHAANKPAKP